MRRNPGTYHRMKMANAMTRTRRPPRTGAISARPSGRAAPPAPLPPGASAGRWTRRPPAQSAPPANPLVPPAPWARNATKSPTSHYPIPAPPPPRPLQPCLPYPENGCGMALSQNFTPDLQPSVGSTTPPPPPYTPAPLAPLLESPALQYPQQCAFLVPWSYPPGRPRGQGSAVALLWCQRFSQTCSVAFYAGAPTIPCTY